MTFWTKFNFCKKKIKFANIYDCKLMSLREESIFFIKNRQTRQGVIHVHHVLEFDQAFPKNHFPYQKQVFKKMADSMISLRYARGQSRK